jgi:Flp pilus assembly protein TadD
MATATALAVTLFIPMQAGSNALSAAARSAQTGDWARTEDRAHAAARWQPWSAEPYLLLGQAQAATGRTDAARNSFKAAARRAPNDWRPWLDLAAVTHGKTRAAAVRRLLELDPLGRQ